MNADQFRNAILLLNCVDADEFELSYWVNPDIASELWEWQTLQTEWTAFKGNPARYYIHAGGDHRNRLWNIIEKRLTAVETATKYESLQLLDKAWESINAEGRYVTPHDVAGKAYWGAIGRALEIIESLGGMDPANRSK